MATKAVSLLLSIGAFFTTTTLWACGPFFPPSFIDTEDWRGSHFHERELVYHLTLLQMRFLNDCVPPSPRTAEPEPKEEREEYALYDAGKQEIADNPNCLYPEAWKRLLALPPEERKWRTVRTHYMLGNLALRKDDASAYAFYQQVRQDVLDGFPDNLGLSADSIKAQTRYFKSAEWRCRAIAIEAHYGILDAPLSVLFRSIQKQLDEAPQLREEMLKQPFFAEFLLLAAPEDVMYTGHRFLLADRLAMRAFQEGNFALCQNLLKQAPDHSLIKLYLQARFARREGNYEASANYLRKWLEIYKTHDSQDPPKVDFPRDLNRYEPFAWHEEVEGVLGLVSIDRKDFQEALLAFCCANAWADAAFVAEQYLTTEELRRFVRANQINHEIPDGIRQQLRHLLARALLREKRFSEVLVEDFPPEYREDVKDYLRCQIMVADERIPDETRAQAWLRIGQILQFHNNQFLGYELAPDYTICDGQYDYYTPSELEKHNISGLPRFQYRTTIAEALTNAADLTKNKDLEYIARLQLTWLLQLAHSPIPKSYYKEALRSSPKKYEGWREDFYKMVDAFNPATYPFYIDYVSGKKATLPLSQSNPLQIPLQTLRTIADSFIKGVYQSPCNLVILHPGEQFQTDFFDCSNPMHEKAALHDGYIEGLFVCTVVQDALLILVGKNGEVYPFIFENQCYNGAPRTGSMQNYSGLLYFLNQKTQEVRQLQLYSSYYGRVGKMPPLLWDGETLYGAFILAPNGPEDDTACDGIPRCYRLWSISEGTIEPLPYHQKLYSQATLRAMPWWEGKQAQVEELPLFSECDWFVNYDWETIATYKDEDGNVVGTIKDVQPNTSFKGGAARLLRTDGSPAFVMIGGGNNLELYDLQGRPLRKFNLYCEFEEFHWDGKALSVKTNGVVLEAWGPELSLELTFQEKDGQLFQFSKTNKRPLSTQKE